MQKEIKDLKKVNLVATILDPIHSECEDWEEVVIPIFMPDSEWSRLIYEGCFTWGYSEVIEGYRKYFSSVTHVKDILIHFEKIKENEEA